MKYIEIEPLENGTHENTEFNGNEFDVPDFDTWAVIPDDMPIPESWPYVDLTVGSQMFTDGEKEQEVKVVISMIGKERPSIPEQEPTIIDDMMAMIIDQEYRLTLMEVGI